MSFLENRDKEERPWGFFERFTLNESCTVKLVRVNPNLSLSLQKHQKRQEFWRVLEGGGIARVGNEEIEISKDSEVEVPLGELHRLTAGPAGLLILEIAKGEFDENDIERIEDDFGRITS